MATKSAQRFIKQNRAPRVHIEYEVEDYGSLKKVELPFVMGVAPRAAMQVDNTLTGDGKLSVDLTFESMDDFSPGAVAKKVPALAKLLEARQQLNDLMLYMDGKDGAQELLDRVLKDPELMKTLASVKPVSESSDSGQA
jgi:type VI secretion system protein ImpB